jgi:hypothetical protein
LWVPIVVGLLLAGANSVGAFEVGWGLVAGALLVLVMFVLGRAALASRRALRLVAAGFGARAPTQPGGAPGCRRCGGPLPPSESVIVDCVFCDADNVLGIDARAQVAPTQAHQRSLSDVVRARDRERLRWRGTAVAVLPIAVLAGGMAAASYSVGRELAETLQACEAGDGAACREAAVDYDLGISVAEDDAKAFALAQRGCELGDAESCWTVAQDLYWGWGTDEDPEAADPIRVHACDLGVAEACAGF